MLERRGLEFVAYTSIKALRAGVGVWGVCARWRFVSGRARKIPEEVAQVA